MDRRTFLTGGLAGVATGLAGCGGLLETRQQATGIPTVVPNPPDGVYYPSHVEGVEMIGTARGGDFAFGLMYSYAHRFWNVNGDSVSETGIEGDVHLMASVWDPETGMVLPETGLSLELTRGGSLVSQEVIYPMLSQPMGFHYGGNFDLDGDGDYTVTCSVGGLSIRRLGAFRDRLGEPATAEITFEYSQAARDELAVDVLEQAGEPGAVQPREMEMMPNSVAPSEGELPGQVRGSATSNDARLVVTTLSSPPEGIDGEGTYLAVSARTRYNGMIVPAMGLRGALTRGGESMFEGELVRSIDPDLGYHYGALVDGVEAGDELTLSVRTQPQTARHEGYETAFGGLQGPMPDVDLTL